MEFIYTFIITGLFILGAYRDSQIEHFPKPAKYRLVWKMKFGTDGGHGDWHQDLKIVQSWVDAMNRKYSQLNHWVEKG